MRLGRDAGSPGPGFRPPASSGALRQAGSGVLTRACRGSEAGRSEAQALSLTASLSPRLAHVPAAGNGLHFPRLITRAAATRQGPCYVFQIHFLTFS